MRGFTLVELLVVVLIVGLGISIIGIDIGGNSAYQLRTEGRQFANKTALMVEEAVLTNQQWGVDLYREPLENEDVFGYRWLVRNEEGRWVLPYAQDFAKEFRFDQGTGLRLRLEGMDSEQTIDYKQDIDTQKSLIEKSATEERDSVIDEDSTLTKKDEITPDIWLLSSGEISAFEMTLFDRQNPDTQVVITGDPLGRVSLETGEEDDNGF